MWLKGAAIKPHLGLTPFTEEPNRGASHVGPMTLFKTSSAFKEGQTEISRVVRTSITDEFASEGLAIIRCARIRDAARRSLSRSALPAVGSRIITKLIQG